jgi:hypothetical protein
MPSSREYLFFKRRVLALDGQERRTYPYPDLYIGYPDVRQVALDEGSTEYDARTAMLIIVDGVIGHLQSDGEPRAYERIPDNDSGCPHCIHDYRIDPPAYTTSMPTIERLVFDAGIVPGDGVHNVISEIGRIALRRVKHNTDDRPLEDLPGAFFTPIYPGV